jgi:hypothetical protein
VGGALALFGWRLDRRRGVTLVVICTALAVASTVLAHGTILFILAIVNVSIAVAANGVCLAGRAEPERIPDWAIDVSVVTTAASGSLLIAALVVR